VEALGAKKEPLAPQMAFGLCRYRLEVTSSRVMLPHEPLSPAAADPGGPWKRYCKSPQPEMAFPGSEATLCIAAKSEPDRRTDIEGG
jgi:hypothetical protein